MADTWFWQNTVVAAVECSSSYQKDARGRVGEAALSSCERHFPSSCHSVMALEFNLPVGSLVGCQSSGGGSTRAPRGGDVGFLADIARFEASRGALSNNMDFCLIRDMLIFLKVEIDHGAICEKSKRERPPNPCVASTLFPLGPHD